jgi:DNA-binding LacI/PurR family transcriptional regulator
VTIRQVAVRAGVSHAAASYALNDRPGVSAQTRARVTAAAAELGWAPNPAARALVASRANAVGLVLVRPPRVMTVDSYVTQMLSGVQAELNGNDIALVLHLVDSVEQTLGVYRAWWAGRHVDGVIVTDLRRDDPRLPALQEIGLPAAVIGGSPGMEGFSTVESDIAEMTRGVVSYLFALGHRSIARVAGDEDLHHTWRRDQAYAAAVERVGGGAIDFRVLYTDYSAAAGMRAVRRLLTAPAAPTAVVFDNDVMAAAALRVATEMGLRVPDDFSVVAWDDSELCEIVVPSVTAVEQAPARQAELAARAVLAAIGDGGVSHVTLPPGTLAIRESTSPVAARRRRDG